jgi:hypothetical protein
VKVYDIVDFETKEKFQVLTAYNIATTLYYLSKYHMIHVSSYKESEEYKINNSGDVLAMTLTCEFIINKSDYKKCLHISNMLHNYLKQILT